jgi:hypothetical protein
MAQVHEVVADLLAADSTRWAATIASRKRWPALALVFVAWRSSSATGAGNA